MASSLPLLLLLLCSLAQSQIRIFNLRATGLPSDLLGTSDGYVVVGVGGVNLGKTSVRHDSVNPWWDEEFSTFKAKENDSLLLEVYDHDLLFDDKLGECQRAVRLGTWEHDCYLADGGVLHYAYTLG